MKQKQTAIGSKFFNFRLFLEALKRLRVIGIAIAILALTAALLIPTVSWISEENHAERNGDWVPEEIGVDEDGVAIYEEVWVPREVEPQPVEQYLLCLPLYVLPFLAPLLFFVLFSFLHKRKQSDFYHAIPYTRTCVYVSFVSAALVFIFAIQILSAAISGVIYAACPYLTYEFGTLLSITGVSMLSAAFLSSFMMLALTVTGTGATTAILFFLFASIVRIVCLLFSFMVDELSLVSARFYPYLSLYWYLPIRMFAPQNSFQSETIPSYSAVVPYTLVATLALFAASGLLYKLRRSEMAERSAPSKRLQSIFRCLFTLPFALILTALIVMDEIEVETFLILLTVILVVFYLYELITTKRLRNMLRATPWLSVVLAGSIVFVLGYVTFYYTVHREIPPERIEAVMVETEGANTYESLNTANLLTEDERVITLVSNALSYSRDVALHGSDGKHDSSIRYHDVTIKTTMGTTIHRTLRFTASAQETLEKCLAESEEYSDRYLELPSIDEVSYVDVGSVNSSHHLGLYLSDGWSEKAELEAFWETFRAEYESLPKSEQLAFKKTDRYDSGGKYPDKAPTFPSGSNVEVDHYGFFFFEMRVEGYKDGHRFYSNYVIPTSMPKTLAKIAELTMLGKQSYQEFYAEEILDGSGKPLLLSTDNGDTPKEIAKAALDAFAKGDLTFTDGEMILSRYGSYELSLYLTTHEPDYAEFFALLSGYLDTASEIRPDTAPVYFSSRTEKYVDGDYKGRADYTVALYLTEDEYNELLFALYLTPFQ